MSDSRFDDSYDEDLGVDEDLEAELRIGDAGIQKVTSDGKSHFMIPVILMLLILGLAIVFNLSVVDVRYKQLDNSLYTLSKKLQDENKSFNIIAKISLIKNRILKGEDLIEDYKVESEVMAVITKEFLNNRPEAKSNWNYIYPFVQGSVSFIRFLLGKEELTLIEDKAENKRLEAAYFLERARNYTMAMRLYEQIKEENNESLEDYLDLHYGFCLTMLGKLKQAQNTFEKIISRNSNASAISVSWQILDFINNVIDQRDRLTSGKIVGIKRARSLFLNMNYRESIRELAKLIKNKKSLQEALFYKGRSYEELGENSKSMDAYKRIINEFSGTSWAKKANRRIYMLGKFYEQDKELSNSISKIALSNVKKFKDDDFFNELNSFTEIMAEKKTDPAKLASLIKKKKSSILSTEEEDLLAGLDDLNFDLDGSKREEKDYKDAVANAKKIKASLKTKVKKVYTPETIPLRKPSEILRIIYKRKRALTRFYNKKLKEGKSYSGIVYVSFEINPNGKTYKIRIGENTDTSFDKAFRNNVIRQIKTWRFVQIDKKYGKQVINCPPFKFTNSN